MSTRTWEIDAAPVNVGSSYMAYVAVNAETREVFKHTVVTPSAAPSALAELLGQMVSAAGIPAVVITDNSPMLTSQDVEKVFARLGIRHELRRPFDAQACGFVEREIRKVLNSGSKEV